tara:strand:+ start:295 stop:582 length:288 start_codon:yes stop_codon:yes gene_type:complete
MKFFKQFSEESEGPPTRAEIAKRKFADNRSRFTDIRKKQLDNKKSKNAAAKANADKSSTSKFNTQTTKLNTIGAKKPEDKKKPKKPLLGIRKETE